VNYDLLYDIYENSIKKNLLTKESFINRVKNINPEIYIFKDKAFYMKDKNSILLLCVKEKYQNIGIGTELLKKCEEEIKKEGHKVVRLGHKDFLKGVPFEKDEFMFFDNRGYEDTKILSNNIFDVNKEFKASEDISVEYLRSLDFPIFKMFLDLHDYNLVPNLDLNKPIIVAREKNKFIGFCQIAIENYKDLNENVGVVTNLFLMPKYRKCEKGYALFEFIRKEFKEKNIKLFEIDNFNSAMLEKENSGKVYVKYYVGVKDLGNE
jgi:GNAT superfamily N-acetyltransferase